MERLFDLVQRDVAFYESSGGGVTLSGGEPLAQPEAVVALLRRLHAAGTHTALDTCGAVADRPFAEALEFVDLVLFDVKTVDPSKHERLTGVPFERVAASARLAEQSGKRVWVRTPVIPGYTDDEEELRGVARFVRETLTRCERHDLLAFSNLGRSKYEQLDLDWELARTPLVEADRMAHLCGLVRGEGVANVRWSGPTRLEEPAP